MTEAQTGIQGGGWARVLTRTGRYEYQFQGSGPAMRNGQYENAKDYQFLVIDDEGWLYRIPVRVAGEAEEELRRNLSPEAAAGEILRVAEAQLRKGLEQFKPRQNAPYPELDQYFAVDAARGLFREE